MVELTDNNYILIPINAVERMRRKMLAKDLNVKSFQIPKGNRHKTSLSSYKTDRLIYFHLINLINTFNKYSILYAVVRYILTLFYYSNINDIKII